jgi:hypothetical protein
LISLKFSQEFPNAVFLEVDVESLVGEVEGSSLQTRVPVPKGNNFGSDCWISLNFSQEFPEAVFLGGDVELQLGEEEVSSLHTGVPVRKGHNF